jgi:hypothetical protein
VPCVAVPQLPLPQLPGVVSLGIPSLPTLGPIDLTLCCHIHIPIPDLPYPLNLVPPVPPLLINIATITVILGYVGEVNTFLSLLAFDCPFN